MAAPDTLLIPPGRLGALLSSRRRELGKELAEISAMSAGQFTPSTLADLERGRAALGDHELEQLTRLYEIESGPIAPARSKLIVDLDGGMMSVGQTGLAVGGREIDQVLERYLSLLYVLRNIEPGKPLTLRDPDMAVLSETLEESIAALEHRLGELMLGTSVDKGTKSLARRLMIPGAGLLVGLTTLGALVIVGGGGSTGSQADATRVAPSTPAAAQVTETASAAGVGDRIVLPSGVVAEVVQSAPGEVASLGSHDDHEHDHDHEAHAEEAAVGKRGNRVQQTVAAPTVDGTVVSQVAYVDDAATADVSYAELGAEAEAMISYDFRALLPDWTFTYEGDTAGYRGMTNLPSKTISIFVNDGDTASDVAEILAHEVGHALDVTFLDDADRFEWLNARGMPAVWWAGNGLSDFDVGAGDFAEAAAAWMTGSASNSAFGEFTPEQIQLVAELLP